MGAPPSPAPAGRRPDTVADRQAPPRNGRGQPLLDLAQWRTSASHDFGTLHITAPAPDTFRAAVDTARVGEVSLFDMTTPPHQVERHSADIPPSAPTWCKLSLQLQGTCTLTQDGRTVTLRPGDLALYVTSRPYTLTYAAHQHSLVVKFPRSFVHLPDEELTRLTATAVTNRDGLGRVAVPLFEQLALNLRHLGSAHAAALVRSALDMLVTVFVATLAQADPAPSGGSALVTQARAYIREHLAEDNLGPRAVAAALFVSVRHLHAQFSQSGTSVATYIRDQRLERIHHDLCDPVLADRSIQEIGARWGMPEASHLSRAFKTAYGISPSALRRRALSKTRS